MLKLGKATKIVVDTKSVRGLFDVWPQKSQKHSVLHQHNKTKNCWKNKRREFFFRPDCNWELQTSVTFSSNMAARGHLPAPFSSLPGSQKQNQTWSFQVRPKMSLKLVGCQRRQKKISAETRQQSSQIPPKKLFIKKISLLHVTKPTESKDPEAQRTQDDSATTPGNNSAVYTKCDTEVTISHVLFPKYRVRVVTWYFF